MSVQVRTDFRQYLRLPGPFRLAMGGVLPEVTVAFETYGTLNATGDNVVLVCHALTGDSHVAMHEPGDVPGWWDGMVGRGMPIDTDEWFVVCSNILGGCRGTTGPSSINPATGRRYNLSFPTVTVGDMVRVQRALLAHLGIRRIRLVVGGSLGGMQALEWALMAPDMIDRVLVAGAPWASSPQAIAWNEIGRHAIMTDPEFRDGDYEAGAGPRRGLAIARMVNMISYRSWEDFNNKFGRDTVPAGTDPVAEKTGTYATQLPQGHPFGLRYQIESYLHYQGEKLVRRFDANTYLYLTRAMDMFDCSIHGEEVWQAVRQASPEFFVVGISSDLLYPVEEVKGLAESLRMKALKVTYRELKSSYGHDAFLLDLEQMGQLVTEALY